MDSFSQWQPFLLWASGFSLLALLLTIAAVPWVVARLSPDYFSTSHRSTWRADSHAPFAAMMLVVLKNALGLVLLLLGVVMLFTPGQGLLTLLAGVLLMNFPGKYRLERWLVLRPGVLRGLNWLRTRRGQPPFIKPSVD